MALLVTAPERFSCKRPFTWTAPLFTMEEPAWNTPVTNSSGAEDVLLIVNVAEGLSVKDFALAISTWPAPVGAITIAIWFGLLKPGLSIFWERVVLFINWIACAVPAPELNTEPVVWVKLPLTLSTLLPVEPVLPRMNAPLDI